MRKDKEISVNVTAAISHYNRRRGKKNPKMTMESLSKIVFHDEAISDSSGITYLSHWNSGKMNMKKCELKHVWRIEDATGMSICELIIIN